MCTYKMCFLFIFKVFKHSIHLLGGHKQQRGSSEACHSKPHVSQHILIDLNPAEKGAFQA